MGDELHQRAEGALDKLEREHDILASMREVDLAQVDAAAHVGLLKAQAKRVRAACNVVVRTLAQYHDHLQPGGTRR